MLTKRLISALLDQVAVLSVAVEALANDARRYDQGYEIENPLQCATSNMPQVCDSLSELEHTLINKELSA